MGYSLYIRHEHLHRYIRMNQWPRGIHAYVEVMTCKSTYKNTSIKYLNTYIAFQDSLPFAYDFVYGVYGVYLQTTTSHLPHPETHSRASLGKAYVYKEAGNVTAVVKVDGCAER